MFLLRHLTLTLLLILVACSSPTAPGPTPQPDPESGQFALQLSQESLTLEQGQSEFVAVTIAPTNDLAASDFAQSVTLTVSNLPEGVTATFSGDSAQQHTLQLTAESSVAPGTYSLVIQGDAGDFTEQTSLSLTIIASSEGAFELVLEPASLRVSAGETGSVSVRIRNLSSGLSNPTLTLEGVPEGVKTDLRAVAANQSHTLTISTATELTPGTYTVIVRARTGSVSRSASLTLTITAYSEPAVIVSNLNDSGDGSLREAILQAEAGEVIGFDKALFATPQTIKLYSELIIDKDLTIRAPATLTLDGQTVTRHITVMPGATVVLENFTLIRGFAQSIVADIEGSYNAGGAVFNTGKLSLRHVEIYDSKAVSGGAMINYKGELRLEMSHIGALDRKNMAGGAAGGIASIDGNLTIIDSHITGNTAKSLGGGIYHQGGILEIESSVLAANQAQIGGAIWLQADSAINLSTIGGQDPESANIATIAGGGIANYGNLELAGTQVIGNRSGAGGGIANFDAAELILDYLVLDDEIYTTIERNMAERLGGGIYNLGSLSMLNFGSIAENSSERGAGIYNAGSATIMDASIAGNQATLGGGLFVEAGEVNIEYSQFTENVAAVGGGIHNASGRQGKVTLIDVIFRKNEAEQGGAVSNGTNENGELSTLHADRVLIAENIAYEGGGIFNRGILQMQNASNLTGNIAYFGAGLYNSGGATLSNTVIHANTSAENGGGIFNAGSMEVSESSVTRNEADFGGGIYNRGENAELSLINTYIGGVGQGNLAYDFGGGIFNNMAYLSISFPNQPGQASVSLNRAGSAGGGVYNLQGTLQGVNETSVKGNAPDDITERR